MKSKKEIAAIIICMVSLCCSIACMAAVFGNRFCDIYGDGVEKDESVLSK